MSTASAVSDLTDVGSPQTPLSSFLRKPMNWLLLFIPITVALEHLAHVSAPVLFFMAAVAIIPIAAQIVGATEQLAHRTGDAVGGLLNATFGNAPELIIAFVALKAGLLEMVRASLIGAILANLMLALGVAFLLGGLRYHEQRFNATAARAYSTMMFLAAVSMTVPSAFSRVFGPNEVIRQEQLLNIGIAVLLLIAYGLYILFSLRTHTSAFASVESETHAHDEEQWSVPRAVITLLTASVLAAWMSEILVGAAEETGKALGMSQLFIGIVFVAIVGGAAESGSAIAMARKNKMDCRAVIGTGKLLRRPAAIGARLWPCGDRFIIHRRDDWRTGQRRWPGELVQGSATDHGLHHHRDDVLSNAATEIG